MEIVMGNVFVKMDIMMICKMLNAKHVHYFGL